MKNQFNMMHSSHNLKAILIGLLLLSCGFNFNYSIQNISHNPEILILTLIVSVLLISLPVLKRKIFILIIPDLLVLMIMSITLFYYRLL